MLPGTAASGVGGSGVMLPGVTAGGVGGSEAMLPGRDASACSERDIARGNEFCAGGSGVGAKATDCGNPGGREESGGKGAVLGGAGAGPVLGATVAKGLNAGAGPRATTVAKCP